MSNSTASNADTWRRTFLHWYATARNEDHPVDEVLDRIEHEVRSHRLPITYDERDALNDSPNLTAIAFIRGYEEVHAHWLRSRLDRGLSRRQSGSYFTPGCLISPIIEHAVVPALSERVAAACRQRDGQQRNGPIWDWPAGDRSAAANAIAHFSACDPSCGAGDFLIAAGNAIAQRFAWAKHGRSNVEADELFAVRRLVARTSLHGIEIDPLHARAARLALWIWCGAPSVAVEDVAAHIAQGDALSVERQRGEFDVVIGNPPFANAIEGCFEGTMKALKENRAANFPELKGTADQAYYFLALADRIAKPDGSIGLVLPRALLSAPSAGSLRERLTRTRPPAMIFAPPDQYLFRDANVFVVSLALRPSSICLVSRDAVRDDQSPRFDSVSIRDENWWAPVIGGWRSDEPRRVGRVDDHFDVFASLTTGMAYDLLAFLVEELDLPVSVKDDADHPPLRLVTTGLIEPGECCWGRRVCRYLKQRFQSPVIDPRRELSPSLRDRIEKVRRPKVLVAGLSTRVEAVLDSEQIFCGAVSTWTIVHRKDDREALGRLCDYLNSAEATHELNLRLGATAMGGGRITITKEFLKSLPAP